MQPEHANCGSQGKKGPLLRGGPWGGVLGGDGDRSLMVETLMVVWSREGTAEQQQHRKFWSWPQSTQL